MEIGRLDRSVTIQSVSLSNDAYGDDQSPSWSTHATVWARKDYNNGSEGIESDQLVHVGICEWTIRHLSTVTAQMRIYDGTDYWYIIRIEEIGRTKGMKLTTEKRDNE